MKGKISQIIGAVVDVRFEGSLPALLNALTVEKKIPRLRSGRVLSYSRWPDIWA